jgi:hypothetical protein
MTQSLASRQPSDNLEELQGQLLRELTNLQERPSDEPELYRAYLQHALVLAWRGVADGRIQAPREALDCLRAAQPFIARYMPDMEPAAAAAAEIYALTESLALAVEALEARRVEDRISDPRSETERAILQVLADNRGTFLRRGEIHERLREDIRPTPPRVGQILAELHEENVVQKIHGRAQGNPSSAFYALSSRGVELCRSLGLIDSRFQVVQQPEEADLSESEPLPLFNQALSALLDPNIPAEWRSILTGLICNLEPSSEIRDRFQSWAGRAPDDPSTKQLIRTIHASWDYYDQQAVRQQERLPKVVEIEKYRALRAGVESYRDWRVHSGRAGAAGGAR